MIQQLVHSFGAALARKGFAFFQAGDYNLNLIGVRADRRRAGYFDDLMFCLYRVNDIWRAHMWSITTDPAERLLEKPINEAGAAILASPQQCRGAYIIGKHKGRPALVQHGAPVKVWRDNNRDKQLDWGQDEGIEGWYGINLHDTTSADVADLNKSASAGCQVFAVRNEQRSMMDLAYRSADKYGPKFTYTILDEGDL